MLNEERLTIPSIGVKEGQAVDSEIARDRLAMPAAGEEERFLQRVREGEAAALEQFWQRFGARITAYAATRLAGDEELAEEVMVQTLAAAVRSIASFDVRRSSLSAWVYGVARRTIGLELRKQRKRSSVPAAAKVAFDETIGQQAEQDLTARLEAQRQVRALAAALSQAAETQRCAGRRESCS